MAERVRQGERLQELVGRLEQLEERAGGLHLRMSKILLAYGLARPARSKGRARPVAEPPTRVYRRARSSRATACGRASASA